MGGDSDTKFKEDNHLVLPVAGPLPHHSHNVVKSGYQHDVLNSGLHNDASVGGGGGGGLAGGGGGLDKYGDMSSLHLAHNRFLMAGGPTAAASASLHFPWQTHLAKVGGRAPAPCRPRPCLPKQPSPN